MIAKETTMGTKFYMLNDPWHPNWLHKMNPQAPWKQIAPVFLHLPSHTAGTGLLSKTSPYGAGMGSS